MRLCECGQEYRRFLDIVMRTAVFKVRKQSFCGFLTEIPCPLLYLRAPRWKMRSRSCYPMRAHSHLERGERRVKPGDVVVVLGCGPIGLLTQKFAWLKGAKRVIAIDHVDYRLAHAKRTNHVETYNFEKIPEMESYIREITKGGADVVIDCVGLDAKRTPAEMLGAC